MLVNKVICLISIICIQAISCSAFPKVKYPFTNEPIDVVIPSLEKDLLTLDLCIEGIRKYGENVRRIIVVSDKKLTDKAEWFNEKNYPFSKYDLALEIFGGDAQKARDFVNEPNSRIGWIFAQCLKLYAAVAIPGTSSNVLVIDSDTIFLNPVKFLNERNGGLYNPGLTYHMPYFAHMHRLLPGLRRVFPQHSGITHNLLFQRSAVEDLFSMVSHYHKTDFWRAFCRCIDHRELRASACADYEIYFNFVFDRTDQVELRSLKSIDITNVNFLAKYQREGYAHISCHSWTR